MTRINIGIGVRELCDSHLVAEYRELPRMLPFALNRISTYGGHGPRPFEFTLGAGHMSYFLPYGAWLKARWLGLVEEMESRGFRPALTWRDGYPWMDVLSSRDMERAQPLLRARINERLQRMKKIAWTHRSRPSWVTL